ncbi:tRNA (guanine-N1)-methyltransferase [Winogradskyella sp. UBA3174]|uniref:tRNA (guanine-N1)-methyltransferase n=1 Tax=Winogradskyella sp. UBA3174 TaxID=1947785 RepID=UPI0025EC233A|nr:tRNA (guanine-N1)-methyltransferase [Winogradskyella sp. UBA3174]|tara:strand:- start:8118 stop:8747 length:630 start_codon:yes stop_codon:yes gene_type:complete
MKFLIKISLILLISFSFQTITAQSQAQEDEEDKFSLKSGTIDSQFEYVFRKSGNFKGTNGQKYEAVKFASLLTLKANVLDSLKTTYFKLKSSENVVDKQTIEIESLKTQLGNTKSDLSLTNSEKNNMALLGMQMSKVNYNVLMWSVISALLAFLLLFIYKFKGSNFLTKEAKRKLDELETEFEEHRRGALEREQKVRRQLQDELNKNKT